MSHQGVLKHGEMVGETRLLGFLHFLIVDHSLCKGYVEFIYPHLGGVTVEEAFGTLGQKHQILGLFLKLFGELINRHES